VSDDFLFSKIFRQTLEPTHPPVRWVAVFFLGDETTGCEVGHLPTSGVELQNELSYIYSPFRLCGVAWDNFTFTFTFTSFCRHSSTCDSLGSRLTVVSVSNFHVDVT